MSVVASPLHIVVFPLTEVTGSATVIITSSVLVPQAPVTLNVYVDVTVGLATGLTHAVQLNPVEGDHAMVPLPVPVKVVLAPIHIVLSAVSYTHLTLPTNREV